VKLMPRSPLASVPLLVIMLIILAVSPSHGQAVAPDFTLTDINGRRFSLSDFKGRIVLIDFFATWCRTCQEEMPHLKALSNRYRNDTLVIISIDIDPILDTELDVRKWIQKYELDWIVVPPSTDSAGVANKYQVTELPTLILVDQEGLVRGRYVGVTEEEVLRSKVEVIIPEFGTVPLVTTISLAVALLLLNGRRQRVAASDRAQRYFKL